MNFRMDNLIDTPRLAVIIGKNSKTLRRAALKYSNLNYEILLIAGNLDIHSEVKYIRKCGFKCHCIQTNFYSVKALDKLIESLQKINQDISLLLIYQDISIDSSIEDALAKNIISKLQVNQGKIIMAKDKSDEKIPFISKELIVRAFVTGVSLEAINY